ncbi:hypothetical protein ABIE56_002006 [Luteibacter sp. 621]|uniref:hypothetical protein n=1 Tax=Luteibacter sp. 621 TaxID=3373916 RepID=UPI003D21FE55
MAIELIPGSSYQLTNETKIGRCEFRKDEIVVFTSGGYSPYDDCYIYHFVSGAGEKRACACQVPLTEGELEVFELVL